MTVWGRKSTTTDTDPGLLEGLRLYDAGDFAGSIKFLLTKTRTGDPFAAFKLANALSEVGQVRAAIAYWELAISWGSNDSFNNLGNRYKDLDQLDKALNCPLYPPGYTLIPGKHFYRRNPCVHQPTAQPVTRSLGQVVASTSKKL